MRAYSNIISLICGALALLISVALFYLFLAQALAIGYLQPWLRATAIIGIGLGPLTLLYCLPFVTITKNKVFRLVTTAALALAVAASYFYFLVILPSSANSAEPLALSWIDSQLITDSSSNGIVEVGFSYPIFTPTIELSNLGVFTQQANLFFRMTDKNGNVALYRGVRENTGDGGLNVESSVKGLLSRNSNYLFLPLGVPPQRSIAGKVAFIVTHLEDGASFTQALAQSIEASLELRAIESGELLMIVPVAREY